MDELIFLSLFVCAVKVLGHLDFLQIVHNTFDWKL